MTLFLNDNSNPQQGTGGMGFRTPAGADNTPVTRPTTTDDNDKKASQKQCALLKIPPTVKDPRKLFVGGLPSNVTSEEFRSFFDQFGKVVDSVVMFDRITSRSRGFGFVTFEDPAVCSSLLGHGNIGRIVMCGKVVEIKPAEPKVPDETRDSGNAMKAPYTKTTYENVPHAVYDFTMMEQPDSPNTAAVYGFVPSPFYPNTFDDSGAVAPVPLGMYYPMVAPVMPHEQNGAFYGPIPYQYNYADYMPNGTYGYLPTAYPEGLDNYYPGDPESVMQKVAPGIPVKPDDGSEGY